MTRPLHEQIGIGTETVIAWAVPQANDDLSFFPVVDVNCLPECIVWPGSDIGDLATRWWVANDPETAESCEIHTWCGVAIERKDDRL